MGPKPKPIWMQSPWLDTLQGLGPALPVNAQDHGMPGRVEIKPDDVTDLLDEEGIGGELEAYCLGTGMAVDEWLTEIGGGPDCKRKLFRNRMECIEQREVAYLLIAHRDRLSHFGCDWFRTLCQAAWLHPYRCQPGRPVTAGRAGRGPDGGGGRVRLSAAGPAVLPQADQGCGRWLGPSPPRSRASCTVRA